MNFKINEFLSKKLTKSNLIVYELLEYFNKNYVVDNGHSKAMKKVIFDFNTCTEGKTENVG